MSKVQHVLCGKWNQDSEVQIPRSCRVKHFLSKTVDRKEKKGDV